MELLQLRYFCTVARLQNISHAAQYHRIPQPAMSKTISKLEKELGAELFDRRKNRIFLTQAGQQFYDKVTASLQQLDLAVSQLQRPISTETAHLHLLVTALRGKTAEVLSLFHRSHPNVTFRVTSTPESGMGVEVYDLCISDQPPSERYDCSIPLVQRQVDLYAAMAPNHPLAHRQILKLEELEGEPTVSISTSPLQQPVGDLCRERGFTPNIVVSCDDLQCLQRYIRSGTGIAITAPYSWPDMSDSRIQFVKVDAKLHQQVSIYWCSNRPRSEIWFELIRQLQQYFNPTAPFWQEDLA
jgi:DNA-binding transcriptional LysR family regulator